eukprot:667293-Amphidinium_carterae.1
MGRSVPGCQTARGRSRLGCDDDDFRWRALHVGSCGSGAEPVENRSGLEQKQDSRANTEQSSELDACSSLSCSEVVSHKRRASGKGARGSDDSGFGAGHVQVGRRQACEETKWEIKIKTRTVR